MTGNQSFLGLALRLARREMRGGVRGFWVFLICLMLGVAAVAAVGVLSKAVDAGLKAERKRIRGGDADLRQTHRPVESEVLEYIRARAVIAEMVRFRAMARAATGPEQEDGPGGETAIRPTMVDVKAVDGNYPLYGELRLESGQDLHEALAEGDGIPGAVAERTLLGRLGLDVGDVIQLGQGQYRLTDVIDFEPDKASNFFNVGPTLILDKDTLPGTGLLEPGSLAFFYYNIRFTDDTDPDAFADELRAEFPDHAWFYRSYTTAARGLRRVLEKLGLYLTLVGLCTLLVGGIGVAGAVRGFLDSRRTAIAAMKCLGGETSLITTAYLIQVLFLALAGSLAGLALGYPAALWGAGYLSGKLTVPVTVYPYPGPLLTALGFGLLTALVFSLRPLAAAGDISPARLFHGYDDPTTGRMGRRTRLALGLSVLALFAMTVVYGRGDKVSWSFWLALLVSVALFRVLAWLVMRLARLFHPRDPRLAHALAKLHRPGSSTVGVIFSLGIGLTVLVTVILVDGNLRHQIRRQVPSTAPTYFFVDIQASEYQDFVRALEERPGISDFKSQPTLRARIVRINGELADENKVPEDVRWALRGDRGTTFLAREPEGSEIVAGEWWPEDYAGEPRICFDATMAQGFGIGVGDTLTLNVLGREITPVIGCLREIDYSTFRLNHSIVFAPGTLENTPHTFIATARADSPEAERGLERMLGEQFPSVVMIYMADVISDIAAIFDTMGAAVNITALVVLAAGLLVLSQTLRANLRSRYKEAVIFKVLGGTRRDVIVSLAAEFLFLGGAAALLSALLGVLISLGFVTWILQGKYVFLPLSLALVVLSGMAATAVLGLAGVWSVLGRKAWPVLRNY